jgi:hypothetical protein
MGYFIHSKVLAQGNFILLCLLRRRGASIWTVIIDGSCILTPKLFQHFSASNYNNLTVQNNNNKNSAPSFNLICIFHENDTWWTSETRFYCGLWTGYSAVLSSSSLSFWRWQQQEQFRSFTKVLDNSYEAITGKHRKNKPTMLKENRT